MTATPQQYAHTFDMSNDGHAVLGDLAQLFAGPPFVAGQPDRTAYNCGAKAVVEHIYAMLDKAERGPR